MLKPEKVHFCACPITPLDSPTPSPQTTPPPLPKLPSFLPFPPTACGLLSPGSGLKQLTSFWKLSQCLSSQSFVLFVS